MKFLRKNKEKYLITQNEVGKEEPYRLFSNERYQYIVRKAK